MEARTACPTAKQKLLLCRLVPAHSADCDVFLFVVVVAAVVGDVTSACMCACVCVCVKPNRGHSGRVCEVRMPPSLSSRRLCLLQATVHAAIDVAEEKKHTHTHTHTGMRLRGSESTREAPARSPPRPHTHTLPAVFVGLVGCECGVSAENEIHETRVGRGSGSDAEINQKNVRGMKQEGEKPTTTPSTKTTGTQARVQAKPKKRKKDEKRASGGFLRGEPDGGNRSGRGGQTMEREAHLAVGGSGKNKWGREEECEPQKRGVALLSPPPTPSHSFKVGAAAGANSTTPREQKKKGTRGRPHLGAERVGAREPALPSLSGANR